METGAFDPWFWSEKLIAVAVLLQTVELLELRVSYSDSGIWQWSIVRKDFAGAPCWLRNFLDVSLLYKNFVTLLGVQLLAAAYVLAINRPGGVPIYAMFAVTLLAALRWRGTFNGGADSMTVLVLLVLSVSELFAANETVRLGCMWYLAIQACLSYFIAGVSKIRDRRWRNGEALTIFVSVPPYAAPPGVQRILRSRWVSFAAGWAIVLFELAFPAALLNSAFCLWFLAAAFLFHLANCYIFGLNRFLFAWAAAYPALYFCSMP